MSLCSSGFDQSRVSAFSGIEMPYDYCNEIRTFESPVLIERQLQKCHETLTTNNMLTVIKLTIISHSVQCNRSHTLRESMVSSTATSNIIHISLLTTHVNPLSCANVCPSLCSVSMLFHLYILVRPHTI